MKAESNGDNISPAEIALRRAARGVLEKAIESDSPIPIWNGSSVVWEIPQKQLEQLDALESCGTGAAQNR